MTEQREPAGSAADRAQPTFRIIYNRRAGRRRTARFEAVLDRLRAAGARCEVLTTTAAGDAARFARQTTLESADLLVVAGGDGTLNDTLQGVGPDTPPLGLIPLGTANVLAHELGIGREPEAIVACLMRRRLRRVRLGVVNERRFMMMAGVGLDAQVVSQVRRATKNRFGKAAYVFEALRTVARWRCPGFRVSLGGAEREAATVVISNGKRYGGGFVLAPQADVATPSFHVTLFPPGSALSVALRAMAIPPGLARRLALVEGVEAETLEVLEPAGAPVQADGDVVARLPARFSFSPDPVRICAPDGEA
ncbi:YegS/Rv2252/BmrU family lipid kinase [Albimonas sp. CAU 1670]|uniref:diacylglycerol/lipid kinase family protein n=1 Tax=Albimonas sp. CAU 1670 TaxID=3032599 RepID=UPI0023DC2983|nr:YegS/Rv2252/BmrU family lipid kinase [Albimonas sp. CAU 1670]MDF2234818.1 YegS/Rv2252/BmrU family lipid kinase [Albimonas sp. CAU 1670]